jgi:hypothetical protein
MNQIHLATGQRGAATLLIALILMTSITLGTLGVARTQLVEQKIAGNDSWNSRLSLQAEAGLARGLAYLNDRFDTLVWTGSPGQNRETHRTTLSGTQPDIGTELEFIRTADSSPYIVIQATSYMTDNPAVYRRVSQSVRPLSVLSPVAETAPPLVVNNCLGTVPRNLHIRPINADSARAGDAAWLGGNKPCPGLISIDTHKGTVSQKPLGKDLWPVIFSIDREEFISLATQQQALPAAERRYWQAVDSDLRAGRWHRSLGSADKPVVLHVPARLGCPQFSAGVRLYGIVYIDSPCPQPVTDYGLEVFGSLIVNGSLSVQGSQMQLNHIQIADQQYARLDLPILRSVRVPGSWKDF